MKILQSLLYGLALAGPQQDDTEEMCGGVSQLKKRLKSRVLKIRPRSRILKNWPKYKYLKNYFEKTTKN